MLSDVTGGLIQNSSTVMLQEIRWRGWRVASGGTRDEKEWMDFLPEPRSNFMWEDEFSVMVDILVLFLEAIGILVMLGGFVYATTVFVTHLRRWTTHKLYLDYRRRSGRGLILGLEFLVAADIIKTVAVDYSLESVLMLGIIIIIRTFLVFALTLEIEGRLPWVPENPIDDAPPNP